MDNSETSINLFKEMGITCTAFGKRKEVLDDFSDRFLEDYGITREKTVKERVPEDFPSFIKTRDRNPVA